MNIFGLLRAATTLPRPAGCLVLVVWPSAPAVPVTAPEDFGPLVAAAREAGLGYLQHIVAVRAEVSGDQFVYYATDDELLALARDAQRWKVAHLRVHADLLVFTPRHFAASSARLTDSQDEPKGPSGGSSVSVSGGSS